jgi:hypothetical protein
MEEHAIASIHKEMLVDASVEEVWAAIRERIVDIDDRLRRLAAMRRTMEAHNGQNEGIS